MGQVSALAPQNEDLVWKKAHTGMSPAVRNHAVGDQFHGPELLVEISDESCVAEEDGRAVVVVVRVWR